jgi:hypothetical protein
MSAMTRSPAKTDVWRKNTAAFRSYSAAMDGRRALKFEWGVAWAFACKMCLVSKSSEFKFGEYGGKSARNQNSTNSC